MVAQRISICLMTMKPQTAKLMINAVQTHAGKAEDEKVKEKITGIMRKIQSCVNRA